MRFYLIIMGKKDSQKGKGMWLKQFEKTATWRLADFIWIKLVLKYRFDARKGADVNEYFNLTLIVTKHAIERLYDECFVLLITLN